MLYDKQQANKQFKENSLKAIEKAVAIASGSCKDAFVGARGVRGGGSEGRLWYADDTDLVELIY